MNHLTDEQLTMLVYQESEADATQWNAHLVDCPACRERLKCLSEIWGVLDADLAVPPEFEVNVNAIVESELPVGLPATVPLSTSRVSVGSAVVAASLLLFVGGASFFVGGLYQASRTTGVIQDEVVLAMKAAALDSERTSNAARDAKIEQGIDNQISRLKDALAVQNKEMSERNLIALSKIEARFHQMLNEQRTLRTDLQTLAINAEGEITIAQHDIRRINEFVSMPLPVSQ